LGNRINHVRVDAERVEQPRASKALTAFRSAFGGNITVRVFPALPNSLAVAFGQALLPKADPRIVVHDMNRQRGGWIEALELLKRPESTVR